MVGKRIAAIAASIVIASGVGLLVPDIFIYSKALSASSDMIPRDGNSIIVDGQVFSTTRNASGDTWSFDAETKTLSLSGYEGMYIDLGAQEEVTVEVSGVNKVTSNLETPAVIADGDVHVVGDGELMLYTSVCHSALCSRYGNLTITDTSVSISATGDNENTEYLISSAGSIEILNSTITIDDQAGANGGAIGAPEDILIGENASVDIGTNAMGIASAEGSLHVDGENTRISIVSSNQSIYAKSGFEMTGGAVVNVVCSIEAGTAVFSPNGSVRVESSDLSVECGKTAVAGKFIVLADAYLATPLDGEISEVSSMKTIVIGDAVAGTVEILRGQAPTPTPSPTPTRRPVTPVPTKVNSDFLSPVVTSRMIAGAGLVVLSLITVAVIIIRKVRSRDRY